ncbi:MAG: hypothetical protein AAGA54_05090 [Myxococcota bacterium]
MSESLTNMEAVKPKGPKLFVGALALAAAGGVAWFFLGREPGPVGEPEDPGKLLLVGADDPAFPVLAQLGFTLEADSLANFAAAGRSEGAPEGSSDVDAVLHHADVLGYGYVAFASPNDIDFGSRAVSSDSADIADQHAYAVFSVGDFATPTKVTVDPNPKRYDVPPYAELLRALFEQDELAATLVGENNLSIKAKPLYERIEHAVELKGAYGLIENRAASAQKRLQEYVVDSEEAEPKPAVLVEGIERGRAVPLANGGVLVFVDAPVLQTPTESSATLAWTGDTRAYVLDPATGDRTRCEAQDRWSATQIQVNNDASVILTPRGSRALEVFTVDPNTPGCAFTSKGTIDRGDGAWGIANAQGTVVRAAEADGTLVAEVHVPDESHAQSWPLVGCTRASRPVWVDATHIAAACTFERPQPLDLDEATEEEGEGQVEGEVEPPPAPQHWLYLISLEDGSTLATPLPATFDATPTVWAHPGGPGPRVLMQHWSAGTAGMAFGADVFSAPPLDPDRPAPGFVTDAAAGVQALRADAATVTTYTLDETARDIVVSPAGTHLAHTVDRGGSWDQNVAVFDLVAKKTTRIGINEWAEHDRPRFTADGSAVLFDSAFSMAGGTTATVPRSTPVP